MNRRLPELIPKTRVCIICEGDEEFNYLKRLDSIGVWDNHYEIVLVNADGNGNIPARYQDRYQNDTCDIVFVFCDTDRKPYEQYVDIKNKIDVFHGIVGIANEIVIFGNPCTMDIIIKHWADVNLQSPAKKINAPIIERYTGIQNYKAKKNQIIELMNYVTKDNYYLMKKRVLARSSADNVVNSSNFNMLIDYLEDSTDTWINEINSTLDGEDV